MVKPAMVGVDSSTCNDSCSTTNNTSSSKMYKGVRKRKWGKWVSEIRLPNSRERIWLGSYDTQEKAARAFDAALYCLRGKSASFNFPDTPHNLEINVVLPHHQSLSPQEIQEVAAKFANNDPPLGSGAREEEPSSESQSESKSNNTTETTFANIYGGTAQVDQGDCWDTTDWTFLNMLDDLNCSDFGPYYGPDKMHPGEFLCPTQAPLLFQDNGDREIQGGDDEDHDAFSNHSFLWGWNF
ncbi:regulation of transcription [Spatholobus suberectus]|nr:regulation of transcription [Spatholobus suberectus]